MRYRARPIIGNLVWNKVLWLRYLILLTGLALSFISSSCQPNPLLTEEKTQENISGIHSELSSADMATLDSLQQVDDYPLYTMIYQAEYSLSVGMGTASRGNSDQVDWACSLFTALGDSEELLLGRNFDWDFSPGMLLFTDPPDGYASVSMVDLYYLGYGNDHADGISDLSLEERAGLLDAPYYPFDGMNETGLAISMAAVPERDMEFDPAKETIDSLMIIRKILDGAATLDEAVAIIKSHNIDWGGGPALHYLIADRSGQSGLIEFSGGNMQVIENQGAWQAATNFLESEKAAHPDGIGWRYPLISDRLENELGQITPSEAMALLSDVAQNNTQWSVVYRISAGEVQVVMGRQYGQEYIITPFLP
jgi:hypothetical protein